jgi:hypothetical protein
VQAPDFRCSLPGLLYHRPYAKAIATMERPFQFRLSSVLWLIAWAVAWLGCMIFGLQLFGTPSPIVTRPPWVNFAAGTIAVFAFFTTPCAAIGALLGKAKRGLVVGIVVSAVAFIALQFLPLVPAPR